MLIVDALALACLQVTQLAGMPEIQESEPQGSPTARLVFDDNSSFKGPIAVGEDGGLLFAIDGSSAPVLVDLEAVQSLDVFSADGVVPFPIEAEKGMDLLTLARRQSVYGRVLGFDQEAIVFESKRFGRLTIPLQECGDLIPPGIADSSGGIDPAWSAWISQMDAGSKLTIVGDALQLSHAGVIAKRGWIGDEVKVALKLSWQGEAEFSIHIGGDPASDPPTGVIVRTWGRQLMLYTWDGETLDLAPTGVELAPDSGCKIQLLVDSDTVRVTAIERSDGEVAGVNAHVRRRTGGNTIAVEAHGRRMKIELAGIVRPVAPTEGQEAGLIAVGRPVLSPEVNSFDGATREFSIDDGTVRFDDSLGIRMAWGEARIELAAEEPRVGATRVTCTDGEAIEADWIRFMGGGVLLKPRWSEDEVHVPLADLWSVRRHPVSKEVLGNRAVLEVEGKDDASVTIDRFEVKEGTLRPVFRMYGFLSTVTLDPDVSFALTRSAAPRFHAARRDYPHVIVLRDGQSFPGRVDRLENGRVFIETPMGSFSGIDVAAVKAILVETSRATVQFAKLEEKKAPTGRRNRVVFGGLGTQAKIEPGTIDQTRLERALLVPRTEASDPGTHLFVARNGDLMRANLIAVVEGQVEVAGGAGPDFKFPLDRLASIIHVAPDVVSPEELAKGSWRVTLGRPNKFRTGANLLVDPTGVEEGRLHVEHALLGPLSFGIDEVLRIEHASRAWSRPYVFDSWETELMPEPVIGD